MENKVINEELLEGVTGGASEETIQRWNEEYEIYKNELVPGTIVAGRVSAVADYGVFVDLIPGTLLVGLAESVPNIEVGESCSVYIKNVLPSKLKIKLKIVDHFFDTRLG